MAAVGRVSKVIIDTDILVGHVLNADPATPSALRLLMERFFCYTTVFNAVEAFGICRSDTQREAVERSMVAMKILGLNAKSGKSIGELYAARPRQRELQLLIAGICVESRLPLVTWRKRGYQGIPGLFLKGPEEILTTGNAGKPGAGETN